MLAVDGQGVLCAKLVKFLNKLIEGDIQHTDINEHNHREHFLHNGLGNIKYIGAAVEEYAGDPVNDASGVLADNGNDS